MSLNINDTKDFKDGYDRQTDGDPTLIQISLLQKILKELQILNSK